MNEIFQGFDWKNGKFDDIQKAYLKQYAQEKINVYLQPGPVDERLAESNISQAYVVAELKAPTKFTWYDSPVQFIDSVRDSVRASVWDSVRASVRASVWDSVWDSVGASVWDSVRASVGASVWDSVGDSVRAWQDSGYAQFLQFFNDNQQDNDFQHVCRFEEMVQGYLLLADEVHIVRKPTRIVLNAQGRLHYDHDKAIEWADGTGYYYLHGAKFDKQLFEEVVNQEITLENLGKIENADQRAVAVQFLRPDRLLEQVKAKLIHAGIKGTRLYQVDNFMDTGETEYCMRMKHPSLDTEYIEWVEPSVGEQGNADLCQAVAGGVPLEDYLLAVEY